MLYPPVTPVSARTRSRGSVEGPAAPPPMAGPATRSRIPTATRMSTRRRPLAASVGIADVGTKRKGGAHDGGQAKKRRSDEAPAPAPMHTAEAGPSVPPAQRTPSKQCNVTAAVDGVTLPLPPAPPKTPSPQKASANPPAATEAPTPARTVLRTNPDSNGADALRPRPPTPPRIAVRTPANGYPPLASTPKRPRSPQADGRLTAPKRDGAAFTAPRPMAQTSLAAFFTPQAARQPLGPPVPAVPATAAPARTIAPLPRSRSGSGLRGVCDQSRLPLSIRTVPRATVSFPPSKAGAEPPKALAEPPKALAEPPKAPPLVRDENPPPVTPAPPAPVSSSSVKQPPTTRIYVRPDESASVAKDRMDIDAAPEPQAAVSPSTSQPPAPSVLPVRRPMARPTMAPPSANPQAGPSSKPSQPKYPAGLGSGPRFGPTSRVVSNPIVGPRSSSNPLPVATARVDTDQPRSVSEPSGKSRSDLPEAPKPKPSRRDSLCTTMRREGYSDTARNLSMLNEALANLRLPSRSANSNTETVHPRYCRPARPPTPSMSNTSSVASTPKPRNLASRAPLASVGVNAANASNASKTPKSAPAVLGKPDKRSSASIASLMSAQKTTVLKGVVAYVDVRNDDGSDVGTSFVDMLRNAGARVLTRPTESLTHIVYKGGKPSTAAFWRRLPEERRPHVVGLRWVMSSLKSGRAEPPEEHRIDFDEEDVFQKRQKSMEPKQLGPPRLQLPRSNLGAITELHPPRTPYAPKISSPLKKSAYSMYDD